VPYLQLKVPCPTKPLQVKPTRLPLQGYPYRVTPTGLPLQGYPYRGFSLSLSKRQYLIKIRHLAYLTLCRQVSFLNWRLGLSNSLLRIVQPGNPHLWEWVITVDLLFNITSFVENIFVLKAADLN
jgi:hypothetical protein